MTILSLSLSQIERSQRDGSRSQRLIYNCGEESARRIISPIIFFPAQCCVPFIRSSCIPAVFMRALRADRRGSARRRRSAVAAAAGGPVARPSRTEIDIERRLHDPTYFRI